MNKSANRHGQPANSARASAAGPRAAAVKDMSQRLQAALAEALMRRAVPASGDHTAWVVERATTPIAPARLAAAHPGGAEAEAQSRTLYERCLMHYRESVRAHEATLATDDVGAALAYFVAANLHALQGVASTPQMLAQLERQLSGMALHSAAWNAATASERQAYFEELAILAVLISESGAQAPRQGAAAVANVQRAARGYLQQLLGLDPDRLCLDDGGLSLRGAHDSAGAATGTTR